MMTRCYNAKRKDFKYYGGRGIEVCYRWHAYLPFLQDMGECPDGLTIDRIDSNGHYEPQNCRWATRSQQTANQRTPVSRKLTANEAGAIRSALARGATAAVLAKQHGISQSLVSMIRSGKVWANA